RRAAARRTVPNGSGDVPRGARAAARSPSRRDARRAPLIAPQRTRRTQRKPTTSDWLSSASLCVLCGSNAEPSGHAQRRGRVAVDAPHEARRRRPGGELVLHVVVVLAHEPATADVLEAERSAVLRLRAESAVLDEQAQPRARG